MISTCYIVGAGEYSGRYIPDKDIYIIAADAGYKTLLDNGIKPDLTVGDFDSLGIPPENVKVITVPTEKNETDMSLAIKEGFAAGCKTFIIDGGIGGRFDHTIANIQLLKDLNLNKAHGILLGKEITITSIANESVTVIPEAGGIISVFALGDKAEGVTLQGLKYLLDNFNMIDSYPIGVSNEFINSPALINVKNGTLLITWANQPVTVKFENNIEISI